MASDLIVRIGADIKALQSQLNKSLSAIKQFGFRAERIGKDLSTRVSLPIIGIGAAAVSTFAKFDRLEKGLQAIAGSTAEGTRQFNSYLDVVRDARTTLDLDTAVSASVKLQAVGFSAKNSEQAIRQLGIAATVSGSSIDDVGGVVRQYTQILAKGKIEQEDLNTILERVPVLAKVINEEFGAGTAEQIRATGISMEDFVNRITAAIENGEVFNNVQISLAKSFETFRTELQISATTLGKSIAEAINLQEVLLKLSDIIRRATDAFADLNPNVQKFIVFSAVAAAAVGPLVLAVGATARAIPLLVSGFTTLAAPIKAVSGFFVTLVTRLSGFTNLLLRGGAIGRALIFAKALGSIKVALAVLFSPVTLIVGAVALLVAGFTRAFQRSEFFRSQLVRLQATFQPLIDLIGNLAAAAFSKLSGGVKTTGGALSTLVNIVAGVVSSFAEFIIFIGENVVGVFDGIGDILSGNFRSGFAKLEDTIIGSPINKIQEGAIRVVRAFKKTFQEVGAEPIALTVNPQLNTEGAIEDPSRPPSGEGIGRRLATAVAPIESGVISSYELLNLKFAELRIGAQAMQERFNGLSVDISAATTVFDTYRNGLEGIDNMQQALGARYDGLGEKIALTTSLIKQQIEEGFSPQSSNIRLLQEELLKYTEAQAALTAEMDKQKSAMELIGGAASSAFDAVGKAIEQGTNAFKAFGRSALGALREVIAAEIKLAVVAQVKNALVKVPFPFNVGIAAAAGAGASALINGLLSGLNIPALADGGITTGPTLALIGEAGREAVIPLDRLNEFTGGGKNNNVTVSGVFRIVGRDLVAVLDNERGNQNRVY